MTDEQIAAAARKALRDVMEYSQMLTDRGYSLGIVGKFGDDKITIYPSGQRLELIAQKKVSV